MPRLPTTYLVFFNEPILTSSSFYLPTTASQPATNVNFGAKPTTQLITITTKNPKTFTMDDTERRTAKRSRFDQTEPKRERASRFDRRSRSPPATKPTANTRRSRSPLSRQSGTPPVGNASAKKSGAVDPAAAAGMFALL